MKVCKRNKSGNGIAAVLNYDEHRKARVFLRKDRSDHYWFQHLLDSNRIILHGSPYIITNVKKALS